MYITCTHMSKRTHSPALTAANDHIVTVNLCVFVCVCACQPPPAHTHTLSLARASSLNQSLALWPGPAGAGAKERIITVQVDATVPAEVEACVKKVLGNVCIAPERARLIIPKSPVVRCGSALFYCQKKPYVLFSVRSKMRHRNRRNSMSFCTCRRVRVHAAANWYVNHVNEP